MNLKKETGYNDQELLLMAYVTFISKQIDRSENIIKGMIRQSIDEWGKANNMSLREIKHRNVDERMKIVEAIIDLFLSKIEHLVESRYQRQKIKENAILIYNQWKKSKRTNLSADIISEMEDILQN